MHPYATEIYQNDFANLGSLPGYPEIADAVQASHDAWYSVVEDGVRDGEFNSGIDIFEFQRMMRECVFMSVRWHRKTLGQDIDTLTETLTTVFPTASSRRRRGRRPRRPQPSGSEFPSGPSLGSDAAREGGGRRPGHPVRTGLAAPEMRAIRAAIADRSDAP